MSSIENMAEGNSGTEGGPPAGGELSPWQRFKAGIGQGAAAEAAGRSPEGPRAPRPPDYIWSNEFRKERWNTALELFELGNKTYQEIYDGGPNEQKLNELIQKWKYLEALDNQRSYLREPFKPESLEPEPAITPEEHIKTEGSLADLPTFKDVLEAYKTSLTPEEKTKAKDQISRYFNEAKRMGGLLGGIDESLKELYAEIMRGIEIVEEDSEGRRRRRLTKAQIMDRIEKDRAAMSKLGERAFRELNRSDPSKVDLAKIAKFDGIWEVYADLAVDRFALLLNGGGLVKEPHIVGEFNFEIGDIGVEGAIEYRKLAQGREIYWRPTWANYFEVTAKTPEEFRTAVETFIHWMRTALGKSPDEQAQKANGFKEALTSAGQREGLEKLTVELKLLLEGLVGITGADFANEHYNPDYFEQFWKYAAKDQGPDRMLEVIKVAQAISAAVIWKFDKDPRAELLHSPHGLRGELMGRGRNAIEMRDLQKQILAIFAVEAMGIALRRCHPDDPEKGLSNKAYEDNLKEISKFRSDQGFKNLYEGFDFEEQDKLFKELSGKLPSDLRPAEKLTLARLERARRIQKELAEGKDPDELEGEDKIMFETAKNAVDLAYEIFGAMGEKAKRGGAVLLVDRVDKNGQEFRDYIPINLAEMLGHFAENWVRATYGGVLDQEIKTKLKQETRKDVEGIFADELFYRVGQARRMAIWGMKYHGRDAKLWDFTLLRDGKAVDPNTLGYTKYGVNEGADNAIEKYRYAVPENPRILGYNSAGEEVILVFDNQGRPIGLEYDQNGQAVIYDKPATTKGWSEKARKIVDVLVMDRQRIIFDNLNRTTRATALELKVPVKQPDGTSKPGKITVDFTTLIHELKSHPYARWTANPYPGYQEEWTGLFLSEEAREGAEKIKAGELHWEEAPPHAVQRLLVDPTLERVGHFDLEALETMVVLAAGEEIYQGHFRIGDELYMNFYPVDGSRLKNRTAYILEDHGGSTKEWYHARAEAALWPDDRARRLRNFIPFISIRFAAMSDMWGAPGGALDVFRMMGYGKYRMVGQFAMDKYIRQIGAVQALYEAYFGWYSEQEKKLKEGLSRKLNNEADTNLKKFFTQVTTSKELLPGSNREDVYQQFLVSSRDSLNRIEVAENRATILETVFRGERSPLFLEGLEIYKRTPNGGYQRDKGGYKIFNDKIDWNRDSGSSRHSNKFFHYRYAWFVRSPEGQYLYPDTAKYYRMLDDSLVDYPRLVEEFAGTGKSPKDVNGWDWLEGKMNN